MTLSTACAARTRASSPGTAPSPAARTFVPTRECCGRCARASRARSRADSPRSSWLPRTRSTTWIAPGAATSSSSRICWRSCTRTSRPGARARPTEGASELPPGGRREAALAIAGERDTGLIERLAVPQLAGHLPVALVERLAVVGVQTQAHLGTAPAPDLAEPVRIGERLARETHDVRLAVGEHGLGLGETVDTARSDDGGKGALRAQRRAHPRGGLKVASEGTPGIGVIGRHAFVAAAAGVRVGRVPDLRLPGVVELAAARERQEVHTGVRELLPEVGRVIDAAAARDALLRKVAAADGKVRADRAPHLRVHLKGQPHALLARAAVAIGTLVGARQEGGERVGMGKVQLDPVKAGAARPLRGLRKERRQRVWQGAEVRKACVRDALA